MKKQYVSPEFEVARFRMENMMSDFVSTPGDGGSAHDGGGGEFGGEE